MNKYMTHSLFLNNACQKFGFKIRRRYRQPQHVCGGPMCNDDVMVLKQSHIRDCSIVSRDRFQQAHGGSAQYAILHIKTTCEKKRDGIRRARLTTPAGNYSQLCIRPQSLLKTKEKAPARLPHSQATSYKKRKQV